MGMDISKIEIIKKDSIITKEQLENLLGSFTVEFCGDYIREKDDVELFDVLPEATEAGYDSTFAYIAEKFKGEDIEDMIDFYMKKDDYYMDHVTQRTDVNLGDEEAIVVCAEY